MDFLKLLGESKIKITSKESVVNNYYITVDNRQIRVSKEEFERYIGKKEIMQIQGTQ